LTAELVRDDRATADVGRRARLELTFAYRAGRTVLADAYAEPPFRVGHVFSEGAGLHMIMASSAPGIFGGDSFEQVIRVESGARVRLTSQSALQIHPAMSHDEDSGSAGCEALLASTYDVADDATLHCHWDPVIPFAGTRFRQRIQINLSPTALLYWSDAFMSGREGQGERWAFASLSHELRVTRAATLEYLERYQIVPDSARVTGPWVAGASCYFGTTIVVGGDSGARGPESLHRELQGRDGLRAAVDEAAPGLMVARLMSPSGPAFHEGRAWLRDVLLAPSR
jgi:urease accessory protein